MNTAHYTQGQPDRWRNQSVRNTPAGLLRTLRRYRPGIAARSRDQAVAALPEVAPDRATKSRLGRPLRIHRQGQRPAGSGIRVMDSQSARRQINWIPRSSRGMTILRSGMTILRSGMTILRSGMTILRSGTTFLLRGFTLVSVVPRLDPMRRTGGISHGRVEIIPAKPRGSKHESPQPRRRLPWIPRSSRGMTGYRKPEGPTRNVEAAVSGNPHRHPRASGDLASSR